jgi:hypothetical protein
MNQNAMSGGLGSNACDEWYSLSGANPPGDWNHLTVSGYTANPGICRGISKIEIQPTPSESPRRIIGSMLSD